MRETGAGEMGVKKREGAREEGVGEGRRGEATVERSRAQTMWGDRAGR